jgi:hypothetical protein
MSAPTSAREALLGETTPAAPSPKLLAFIRSLGLEDPSFLPVAPGAGARAGWCHENVARAVAERGGVPVYGVVVWCNDLFATLESHAVLRAADGALVDVTPHDGERRILFAVDPSLGPGFDFLKRPPNRRLRLYEGLSAERRAADLIACMSPAQLRSETRRAEKTGLPLEGFVASRMAPDSLALGIDRFLACCTEAEALLTPTTEGLWCDDVPRWRALEIRKADLIGRLVRTWETHPARTLRDAVTQGPRP